MSTQANDRGRNENASFLDRTNAGEDGEIVKVNSEMMHPLYKLSEAAGDLTSEYVKSHPSPATLQDEPAPAQSLFGGTPTAVAPAANNMFAMGSVAPLVRDKELQKYLSKLLSWIQKFELNYIH